VTARARTVERRPAGLEAGASEPAGAEPAGVEPRPVSSAVLGLGLGAAVAILLGIALVTGFFSAPGSSVPGPTAVPTHPVATVHVVARTDASAMAFAGPDGWLTDADTATVHRFDPSTGATTGTVTGVGQRPDAIAPGGGRIWIADSVEGVIAGLDRAPAGRSWAR
jgi:streptogramin lyase